MRINKTFLLMLLAVMGLTMANPASAQKFTKRAEARREARAKNFFYGHTFTLQAGFTDSWLTRYAFTETTNYGMRSRYMNSRQSFNFGFTWDYAFNRHFGLQTGAFYAQKGGQKLQYFSNKNLSADYGEQLLPEKTKNLHFNTIELQFMPRVFLPLTHRSRLSLGAGGFVGRVLNSEDDMNNWTMGIQGNLAYEWNRLYVGITYQPGIYNKVIDNRSTALNALFFNVGFRLWKE